MAALHRNRRVVGGAGRVRVLLTIETPPLPSVPSSCPSCPSRLHGCAAWAMSNETGGAVRAVHGAVRRRPARVGRGRPGSRRRHSIFARGATFFTIITLHTAHPIIHPVTNSLPERRLRRPLTRSLSCLRTCARKAAPRPSHSSWRRRAQRERAQVHSSCYSQRP
jgi:hypothetical protein